MPEKVCPLCLIRKLSTGLGGDKWCSKCGEPEHNFITPAP